MINKEQGTESSFPTSKKQSLAMHILIHLFPMHPLSTPCKHQKTLHKKKIKKNIFGLFRTDQI